MRSLAPGVEAALAAGHVVVVQLLHIAFPTVVVAVNTSTWNLDWGGVTYLGAYGLGTVSAVNDQPGELQGIQLELAAPDGSRIALALDEAGVVQGSVVTIRTAILDNATYQVLDAPIDWIGYADTMALSEDGAQASICVTCESKAVDLMRGAPMTYSDPDQQALYPGDRAFEYVVDQADRPVVWPAREFFFR
jgi:hypothetical protein